MTPAGLCFLWGCSGMTSVGYWACISPRSFASSASYSSGFFLPSKAARPSWAVLSCAWTLVSWVLYCSAAVFSRLMSAPFSCMSQFSCSSVMPGILFFTSSRFIRRGSFLSIKPRFCDAVLRLRPVVGRVRTARCDGCSRHKCREHGTVCWNRTSGLWFWRPLLCQLSEYGMKKAPLPGWAKTLVVFGC